MEYWKNVTKDFRYGEEILWNSKQITWRQERSSDALHNLMQRSGLAHKWHLMQQGLDEKEVEKEMKKWAADREETLKRRADNCLLYTSPSPRD